MNITPSPAPLERVWKCASQAERDALAANPTAEKFVVLCYNILCEKYAQKEFYQYTPSSALKWDYRKELILTEVMGNDADIVCLQEVDFGRYRDYFVKKLIDQDYEGVYGPTSKHVDGCATFFKKSKYKLLEKQLIEFSALATQHPDFNDTPNRVLDKDNIAVFCLLETIETGTRIVIANTHIYWDPAYCDVKLVQVALLIEELEKVASAFAKYPPRLPEKGSNKPSPTYSDGSKIPLILCGDFNSLPNSGVYEFLANGHVASTHLDFMSHVYGKYTADGLRHKLGLKSAYAACGELPLTNYTPSFRGVLDYIWYGSANLAVDRVLGEVDKQYLEKVVGFPSAHFPSDHVCIAGEFRVKPQMG